jgi:phosphohistidine phosphatase
MPVSSWLQWISSARKLPRNVFRKFSFMKLYLVQHGQAVPKQEDPGRPLSEQGREEVQRVAACLGEAGVRVVRVWHSGKLRATETAGILAGEVCSGKQVEMIKGIQPNDPVDEFASDADVWGEDTLVVGHLPFMSRLVSLLVAGDSKHELVHYTPGSVVCLQRDDTDRWVISWMLSPGLLGEAPGVSAP